MTVVRGLGNILSGGADFITFEEGKPMTLLFIDWYEDLVGIREHYEPALNPKYIRCPGKDVCPLCQANPNKYPALRIKFRVYDPTDNKVKFVSLAKSHIQKLNTDFNLDEIDPTRDFVTIYRTGKGASDTSYSARRYHADPSKGRPVYEAPNFEEIDMPDLTPQVTAHTPEEIAGFMQALLNGGNQGAGQGQTGQDAGAPQGVGVPQGGFIPPQGGYMPPQGEFPPQLQTGYGQPQGAYPQTPPQGAPATKRPLPF
jgi:hypothetical protein